jgi:hypothetical protein
MRVPNGVIALNQIPVRFESVEGECKWRGVKDFEHATLCRAFGLDPVRFYFDLPSSVRGVGSNSSGNRGGRDISGYVMMAGRSEPFGTLKVCRQGERFRDVDPNDKQELYRL